MNQKNKKNILVLFLWVAGFFDVATFFLGNLFEFEANPLYLVSGSIFAIILLKFGFLFGVSYLIYNYKPQKSYLWAYILTFIAISAIFLQILGGCSNIYTKYTYETSPEGSVVPLEQGKAMKTYVYLELLLIYFPLILASLVFYVFERVYFVWEMD